MTYDEYMKIENYLCSLNKLLVSKNREFYPLDRIRTLDLFPRGTDKQQLYYFNKSVEKGSIKVHNLHEDADMTTSVEHALLSIPLTGLYLYRPNSNKVLTVLGGDSAKLLQLLRFMKSEDKLRDCKHFPEFNGLLYEELSGHIKAHLEQFVVQTTEIATSSTEVWQEVLGLKGDGNISFWVREFIWNKFDEPKRNESLKPLSLFEEIWAGMFVNTNPSTRIWWRLFNKKATLCFIILELYKAPEKPFISVDLLFDAVYKDMCHNWSGEYFAAVTEHLKALSAWPTISKTTGPDNFDFSREFGKYINAHSVELDSYAIGFKAYSRKLFNQYKNI